jgi:hypothetical protein
MLCFICKGLLFVGLGGFITNAVTFVFSIIMSFSLFLMFNLFLLDVFYCL